MTDDKSTPAPAAQPSAPAVAPPPQRPEVDLSDLQAELDADSQKVAEDEVFDEIAGKDDAEPDEGEGEDADAAEEADEGKDEEEEDDADAEKPKKRSRSARYRDQILRLEQENAQLRSRVGGSLTKAQFEEHVLAIVGPEPQESDFDNFLDYEHEKVSWLTDKRKATREVVAAVKAEQEQRAARMAENVERHYERIEEFRSRNGEQSQQDYDKVIAAAKDLRVAPAVEELILESPKSAHLQYFFARNPQRLDKINRMSDREAAREIGHIEARLSLPQPKTKTAAPPPKRAPKGGVSPASPEAELNSWLTKKYGNR
jgi:hypothetical protein